MLRAETGRDSEGSGKPAGFRKSERRECIGGHVWRRHDPVVESSRFGTDYESWEAEGAAGSWLAGRLNPAECRATRIDPCWDSQVEGVFAVDVARRINVGPPGQWVTGTGFQIYPKPGKGASAGDERTWTWYVGSRASGLLRIYRKDVQNPLYYPEGLQVLRTELELHRGEGETADAWWRAWHRDEGCGWAAAARQVWDMTLHQLGAIGDRPPIPPRAAVEVLQTLLAVVDQHSSILSACDQAGVDLAELAKYRMEVLGISRKTRMLHRQRVRGLAELGAKQAERVVREAIDARARAADSAG